MPFFGRDPPFMKRWLLECCADIELEITEERDDDLSLCLSRSSALCGTVSETRERFSPFVQLDLELNCQN
jgi:hypothetical protein